VFRHPSRYVRYLYLPILFPFPATLATGLRIRSVSRYLFYAGMVRDHIGFLSTLPNLSLLLLGRVDLASLNHFLLNDGSKSVSRSQRRLSRAELAIYLSRYSYNEPTVKPRMQIADRRMTQVFPRLKSQNVARRLYHLQSIGHRMRRDDCHNVPSPCC
jgi:hypothetical protein